MLKFLSFIFEILRIIILMALVLLVLGWTERYIFQLIFGEPIYHSLMTIGNFIIYFIVYRNYLQFKGWYKSIKNKKLNRFTTNCLLIVAITLILISPSFRI